MDVEYSVPNAQMQKSTAAVMVVEGKFRWIRRGYRENMYATAKESRAAMRAKVSQYDKRQTSYFQKLGFHVVSVGAPRHDKNDANTSTTAKSTTQVPSVIAADFIILITFCRPVNMTLKATRPPGQ
jgi:hypothetical protein